MIEPIFSLTGQTGTPDANRTLETPSCASDKSGTTRPNPAEPRPDEAISNCRSNRQGKHGFYSPIKYYVDGAAPNNGSKNVKAYGSWCRVEGDVITEGYTFYLPEVSTNNEAEYCALINLLSCDVIEKDEDAEIWMDSQLIVNQVNGSWRVKEQRLRPLQIRARQLLGCRKLQWVGRETIERYLGH